MYSVKITGAEKLFVQSDGSTILAVDFDVLQAPAADAADQTPVFVVHYSHGFDLNTTKADIDAYFATFIANYTANAARAVQNAEFDAANATADATIAEIVGINITN